MRPLLYLAEDAYGDLALWQDVPEDSPAGQGLVFDAARMRYVPRPSS